jgi:hypothetical protein
LESSNDLSEDGKKKDKEKKDKVRQALAQAENEVLISAKIGEVTAALNARIVTLNADVATLKALIYKAPVGNLTLQDKYKELLVYTGTDIEADIKDRKEKLKVISAY